jgi:hypothetical protein
MISNIGRYMAIKTPPITTPMKTMMIGSMMEVNADTA